METLRAGTGSKEPGINLDHISSASSFNQYQDYQDLNYESKFNGFYSRDNLPEIERWNIFNKSW